VHREVVEFVNEAAEGGVVDQHVQPTFILFEARGQFGNTLVARDVRLQRLTTARPVLGEIGRSRGEIAAGGDIDGRLKNRDSRRDRMQSESLGGHRTGAGDNLLVH
jgi:hypothetical protein